jgi:hypothetical protein
MTLGRGASAQTRLGLQATQEEVDIWRERRTSDPYQGEWAAILKNATGWRDRPDARWAGQTRDACFTDLNEPSRRADSGMTDAAFVYLLTGETSYRDVVRAQLLAQSTVAGTNFADATKWCASGNATGLGPDVAPWLRRLIYAYSYIRSDIPAEDRATLDTWFLNAGTFVANFQHSVARKRFPNRLADDYSTCSPGFCPGPNRGLTHFGGHMTQSFHEGWNNMWTSNNAVVAAVGVLLDNTTLKDQAKRGFQEWIKYGTFPGGQVMDQFRWNPGSAGSTAATMAHGYYYAGAAIGSSISVAEYFARSGDTSLYTYSTSEGMFGSQGGPKSLLKILQHYAGLTNDTIIEFASPTATTDVRKKIDAVDEIAKTNQVTYVNLAPANVFYQDSAIATAYQRAIPSKHASSGCNMLRGEWCSYPSVRFLFGEMEGKVRPYPSQELPAPATLKAITER